MIVRGNRRGSANWVAITGYVAIAALIVTAIGIAIQYFGATKEKEQQEEAMKRLDGVWQLVSVGNTPANDLAAMTLHFESQESLVKGEVMNTAGTIRHDIEVSNDKMTLRRIRVSDGCLTVFTGKMTIEGDRLRWQVYGGDGQCGEKSTYTETRYFERKL